MSAELTPQARQMAIAELEAIERTLSAMSAWVDGDGERVRASILLEDAAQRVMSATFLIERLDPQRVSELMHRRVPANGHPAD
jgi:hypothetical protein